MIKMIITYILHFVFKLLFLIAVVSSHFCNFQTSSLVTVTDIFSAYDNFTFAYFIGLPVIWAYWHDARHLPLIMQLCLHSFKCHNEHVAHVQLVSDSNINQWIPDVHTLFPTLKGNHKGDYFKARILGR